MEYVVLGVQSWEIEDEKTHKKLDGISVHYLDPASPEDSEDSGEQRDLVGFFQEAIAKLTSKPEKNLSFKMSCL